MLAGIMWCSCLAFYVLVRLKKKNQHIFRLKDWKTGFHPSSSPSVLSAFITVLDQTRVSVSIKLCSLRDDIYVIGQLIFSHCNYRQKSTKYKRGRHTPSSRCLVKSALTSQTERRTARNRSCYSGEPALKLLVSAQFLSLQEGIFRNN